MIQEPKIERMRYVGSRVTCDPAPNGTDLDILIQVCEEELFDTITYFRMVIGIGQVPDREGKATRNGTALFD